MDYGDFCKEVMDFDSNIRYTAVLDKNGKKLSGQYRNGLVPLLNEDEQKMELYHAGQRWITRQYLDHKIGKAKFSLTEYEKIKRFTFPMDEKHLFLISTEISANHDNIIKKILDLINNNS